MYFSRERRISDPTGRPPPGGWGDPEQVVRDNRRIQREALKARAAAMAAELQDAAQVAAHHHAGLEAQMREAAALAVKSSQQQVAYATMLRQIDDMRGEDAPGGLMGRQSESFDSPRVRSEGSRPSQGAVLDLIVTQLQNLRIMTQSPESRGSSRAPSRSGSVSSKASGQSGSVFHSARADQTPPQGRLGPAVRIPVVEVSGSTAPSLQGWHQPLRIHTGSSGESVPLQNIPRVFPFEDPTNRNNFLATTFAAPYQHAAATYPPEPSSFPPMQQQGYHGSQVPLTRASNPQIPGYHGHGGDPVYDESQGARMHSFERSQPNHSRASHSAESHSLPLSVTFDAKSIPKFANIQGLVRYQQYKAEFARFYNLNKHRLDGNLQIQWSVLLASFEDQQGLLFLRAHRDLLAKLCPQARHLLFSTGFKYGARDIAIMNVRNNGRFQGAVMATPVRRPGDTTLAEVQRIMLDDAEAGSGYEGLAQHLATAFNDKRVDDDDFPEGPHELLMAWLMVVEKHLCQPLPHELQVWYSMAMGKSNVLHPSVSKQETPWLFLARVIDTHDVFTEHAPGHFDSVVGNRNILDVFVLGLPDVLRIAAEEVKRTVGLGTVKKSKLLAVVVGRVEAVSQYLNAQKGIQLNPLVSETPASVPDIRTRNPGKWSRYRNIVDTAVAQDEDFPSPEEWEAYVGASAAATNISTQYPSTMHPRGNTHHGNSAPSASGTKSGICFDFQNGKCNRGNECRFSHEQSSTGGGSPPGPAVFCWVCQTAGHWSDTCPQKAQFIADANKSCKEREALQQQARPTAHAAHLHIPTYAEGRVFVPAPGGSYLVQPQPSAPSRAYATQPMEFTHMEPCTEEEELFGPHVHAGCSNISFTAADFPACLDQFAPLVNVGCNHTANTGPIQSANTGPIQYAAPIPGPYQFANTGPHQYVAPIPGPYQFAPSNNPGPAQFANPGLHQFATPSTIVGHQLATGNDAGSDQFAHTSSDQVAVTPIGLSQTLSFHSGLADVQFDGGIADAHSDGRESRDDPDAADTSLALEFFAMAGKALRKYVIHGPKIYPRGFEPSKISKSAILRQNPEPNPKPPLGPNPDSKPPLGPNPEPNPEPPSTSGGKASHGAPSPFVPSEVKHGRSVPHNPPEPVCANVRPRPFQVLHSAEIGLFSGPEASSHLLVEPPSSLSTLASLRPLPAPGSVQSYIRSIKADLTFFANPVSDAGACVGLIVNGKKSCSPYTLLDGGSNVCIMDAEEAQSLGIEFSPTSIRLTTSNDVGTSVLGITGLIPISYGAGASEIICEHCFLIVKRLPGACYRRLIGNADARTYGAIHDTGQNLFIMRTQFQTMGPQSPCIAFPTVLRKPGLP